MRDGVPMKVAKAARVRRVLIGVHHKRLGVWCCNSQRCCHIPFDGLGVRTAVLGLDQATSAMLERRHPALAPESGMGEPVNEVTLGTDHQVQVQGVVLAECEALKAINDKGFQNPRQPTPGFDHQEQAVPSESGGLTHQGTVGTLQLPGDLAVSRTRNQPVEQGLRQVGTLEVVGG